MGLRAISLFSGVAGLDVGVRLACPSTRTVCYVERDEFCQRVLQARMRDGSIDNAPIWDDVTTFDGTEWRGRVDLIVGGFPCQDISYAGKGIGIEGERSGLWKHFARIVGEVRPNYVFVENVSSLIHRGLDSVLTDLTRLGYDTQWGTLRASDVGAPHQRRRVFVLGYLADSECAEWGADAFTGGNSGEGEDREGQTSGRIGECRGDVADATSSGRRPGQRDDDAGQSDLSGSSTSLADACCPRLAVGGSIRRDDGGECATAERSGDALANATGHLRRAFGDDGPFAPDGAGNLPLFPPGPGDAEQWRAILNRWPELAPAIETQAKSRVRDLAHGTTSGLGQPGASRVEQLRALGNAVVPQQAALAFALLWERMTDSPTLPRIARHSASGAMQEGRF